jgi:hypothetical protein
VAAYSSDVTVETCTNLRTNDRVRKSLVRDRDNGSRRGDQYCRSVVRRGTSPWTVELECDRLFIKRKTGAEREFMKQRAHK